MNEKNAESYKPESLRTLRDEEIITERNLPRRSFLSTSGALLAGIAGMVSGAHAMAQDDPKKRPDDAPKPDDQRKPEDRPKPDDQPKPEDRRKSDDAQKQEERRKRDESRKRSSDPDKPTDPRR